MAERPPSQTGAKRAPRNSRLALLGLAALGVVYGDIGTSPIYAVRECFHGDYGIPVTRENVLGIASLVLWALLVIVTLKYLTFMLRADNRGEGGIIALMSLLLPEKGKTARVSHLGIFVALGLFGAALLYGDGVITPAISVLSAVEGLKVAAPGLESWILPATIAILVGLFLFQRRGTQGIGVVFGPVMLVWFAVLAILGVASLVKTPEVLAAVSPHHAVAFLARGGVTGFLALGAVFLVVTGAEALYADMGHFGRGAIRMTWYAVVLPGLLLNYFGQAALLLRDPAASHHPFYVLAPAWALYPLVALTTVATIIASQAVISGAFSLTLQAIQLGYCPRMRIEHTSPETIGQVYIPQVNWVLMASTVGLVLIFRSSSRLAAAYGVAVTTTMITASILFYVVARNRWGWSRWKAGLPALLFLLVDASFFAANITKVAHGAWFPLAIGFVAFTLLWTWKRGRDVVGRQYATRFKPLDAFFQSLESEKIRRVPGRAVYLSSDANGVPPVLQHNLAHNRVLHEEVVLLTVVTVQIPHVPPGERIDLTELGHGFYQVVTYYGFMQNPSLPHVLGAAKAKGLDLSMEETSFFLGREHLVVRSKSPMPAWQARLFALMSRNALGATAYFRLPPERVVEIGIQVEL